MNILFVTIAWPNKEGSNLYSDLMNEFYKAGHNVYVAYADEKQMVTNLSDENGISVLRIKTARIRKAGKLRKAISLPLLGLKFYLGIRQNFSGVQFDLIIGHTPPITLSGLMKRLKNKNNAFFYLLLKDIWPHSSVDLGIIKEHGLVYKFFRWHEKRIYKFADAIGCMSPKNVDYVLENNPWIKPEKVEECPNSIAPSKIKNVNRKKIRKKYEIPIESTVFIISGNLSSGHGFEAYLDVIESLKNNDETYFVIGGSGNQYDYIKTQIEERKLPNVFLYSWLPDEDFKNILKACDVGVVLLSSKYNVPQFPSRLLGYLEASMPVFCAVNSGTDLGDIVENAGCGISVNHGDREAMKNAILKLTNDEELRSDLASNSRKLLEDKYLASQSYQKIIRHLK
ncbi:glycosyltransferase family 4 protein [Rhodohalobacter sp. 8-1]|uniref:glycosyltransferase family 4 protein n=1 Tax=Rhodohalobacter sp. 8-1 TaxID=3131972 RepID=UPI0030EEEED2